jgi:hypothetical protein
MEETASKHYGKLRIYRTSSRGQTIKAWSSSLKGGFGFFGTTWATENGYMGWMHVAKDRDRWWAFVNTVMNFGYRRRREIS